MTAPRCRLQHLTALRVEGAALVGAVPGCLLDAQAQLLLLQAADNGLNEALPSAAGGRLQVLQLSNVS